jgi:predicted Rossmann fold nucleotide-binding protein DprA/Smf involved in DNA uptake
MTSSDDRLIPVLLCSSLGRQAGAPVAVLGPVGWSDIEQRLLDAGLPAGALLNMSAEELKTALALTDEQAARVDSLLRRAGPASIELERLADRGLWFMATLDPDYPRRLRASLGIAAPPVLFGAGERSLMSASSLAVVGSRDAPPDALSFAAELGRAAAAGGMAVASGGARGVDIEAMTGALSSGGISVAIVAEQLERRVREPSTRAALSDGLLAIASPYAPGAGFTVRGAMGRNKIVYGLALAAVVVTAKEGQGGTWSGAVEALRGGTVPVFVRGPIDPGSHPLLALGAQELSWAQPPARLGPSDFEPQPGPHAATAEGPRQDTLFGPPEAVAKPGSKRIRKARSRSGIVDEGNATGAS